MRSSALVFAVLVAIVEQGLAQTASPDPSGAFTAAAKTSSVGQHLPPPPSNLPTASRDATNPAPVYSRTASFTIPFSVAQPEKQGLEVLLFVSHDSGANWTLYNRQPATQGQFSFRTNRDGEYWFASRTIPVGTVISAGATFRPELRVVIDTTPPRLDVQASLNSTGEIQVEWQAADDSIAPETLKVEYQQALGKPYQPVQATGSAPAPGRNAITGRTSWKPEAGSYFVSIRVQVQDKAGNTQEVIRRLIVPISLDTRPNALPAAPALSATSIPSDPLAAQGMASAGTTEPKPAAVAGQQVQEPASTTAPPPVAWPSDMQTPQDRPDPYFTPSSAVPPAGVTPSTPAGQAEVRQVSKPRDGQAATAAGAGTDAPAPAAGPQPNGSSPWDETPLTDNTPATTSPKEPKAAAQEDKPTTGTPAASTSLPAGERPRMTTSKRFNLDYSVDAVGPAGVEKVELWVTRNGGRDWDLGWVDEDRESPLLVEVENEGIYGFRVVIVGKNGLASQTPRSGDLADLWVGVDTTKPVAQITSAEYGSGAYAGQLDIRWTAVDDHLGNRPVTLSFSEKPDGPWTAIASGLPNTGQYLWRVDSRVPAQFYLRLEVRDEAGNTAVHRLEEPLQSAGLTPKGSVRGFAPAGN